MSQEHDETRKGSANPLKNDKPKGVLAFILLPEVW